MISAQDNDLMCRVENGAPMGEIFRRHWIPACLAEEVSEPDGDPVKIRLLGEDLVVLSETTKASSAFSTNIARIAALLWPSAATRNAACAASTTGGSSMLKAMRWRCRPSQPERAFSRR